MKIKDLIHGIAVEKIVGDLDVQISTLAFDSREVKSSTLFVATVGTLSDGHNYIDSAIEKGAVAVVCQSLPKVLNDAVAYIKVEDSTKALALLASNFYGNPSQDITLVGVTGTNGKTSIATLLYNVFRSLGYKVGLLSTVCNFVDSRAIESTHTTPDAIQLNALLKEMVDCGCEFAFMEVSSHAVEQQRIYGLNFDGGVFTNLTRDHIDYHGTFQNYLKAKKAFFDMLGKDAFVLTNIDDKNGMVMLQNTKARKLTYALRTMADYKTRVLEDSLEGMTLEMNMHEVILPFVGRFNAYNLTAVFGVAVQLGFEEDEVLRVLSAQKTVSGRFETIQTSQGFTAIVDYAHTPDALENVLETINEVRSGNGTLYTVVGCGGNRDKGKRPMMAKVAAELSDKLILTSDNPRNEDPQSIIDDMLQGIDPVQMKKTLVIVDRAQAIRTACMMATKGDVLLVAGKGHEDYQIVNGVKHHFDDKEQIILNTQNCK